MNILCVLIPMELIKRAHYYWLHSSKRFKPKSTTLMMFVVTKLSIPIKVEMILELFVYKTPNNKALSY